MTQHRFARPWIMPIAEVAVFVALIAVGMQG